MLGGDFSNGNEALTVELFIAEEVRSKVSHHVDRLNEVLVDVTIE